MRVRLVVRPGSAPQVAECGGMAVGGNDHVREINRAFVVALTLHDRRRDGLHRRRVLPLEPHIGKAAEKREVDLRSAHLLEGLPHDQACWPAQLLPHPARAELADALHARREVAREDQLSTAHPTQARQVSRSLCEAAACSPVTERICSSPKEPSFNRAWLSASSWARS